MEGRVAIALVFLAGFIALPIAVVAWLLGFVSFGNALLLYMFIGWAVLCAGMLSALLAQLMGGTLEDPDAGRQTVTMKVKPANRS